VNDADIEEALDRAAAVPHELPAGVLARIVESIGPSLAPVRPLPPAWVLSGALVAITAAVALLGAARAGFQGFEALGLYELILIFGTLGTLAWVTAGQTVCDWIPGSRRRLGSGGLLGLATASLLLVFSLLFHDYRVEAFVPAGLACLVTGLLHAVPAALLGWWWLRRGLALNYASAGLAAGTLAGIAGVTVLELHCTNSEALHLLVWHTLVVPVSGATGAILGWALGRSSARKRGPPRRAV
jgi:hypothetical protein